jgi:hypothetical protein
MDSVEKLLEPVARDAQPEIQQRLTGFLGSFVRQYLPQTWVFQTEEGAASFHVDAEGRTSVRAGASTPADVTIEIGYARLKAALASRRKEGLPAGPVNVTPHTAKGRAAFDFLRGRLGL